MQEVDLSLNPTRVLPYLDLFSLIILNLTCVTGLHIPAFTFHDFPLLSIRLILLLSEITLARIGHDMGL